ncbi:hypothetical protein [Tenacibaculum xiamenense]|uniref:hypothetical protein n=1 Tax=Tenacibaculum xiamenense TaxID=1261553 RepID=UPI0038956AC6
MSSLKKFFLSSFVFLINSYSFSQRIPQIPEDTIKFYCSKPYGVSKLKEMIMRELKPKTDFYYQAISLGITEEEVIEKYLKDICLGANGHAPWSNSAPLKEFPDETDKVTFDISPLLYCESKWNGTCSWSTEFFVPYGYQACGIDYQIDGRGDWDVPKVTPIYFLDDGSEGPYKYYGYRIKLSSRGNKNYLNRKGANAKIKNLKLFGISNHFKPENINNNIFNLPPVNRNEMFHLKNFKVIKGPIKPLEIEEVPPPPIEIDDVINSSYTEVVYSSINCKYDVYKTKATLSNNCENWIYVGKVSKTKKIKIKIKSGENYIIRVMKEGYGACKTNKKKREDNIYRRNNSTRSNVYSYEIHDYSCE